MSKIYKTGLLGVSGWRNILNGESYQEGKASEYRWMSYFEIGKSLLIQGKHITVVKTIWV